MVSKYDQVQAVIARAKVTDDGVLRLREKKISKSLCLLLMEEHSTMPPDDACPDDACPARHSCWRFGCEPSKRRNTG